MCFDAWSNGGVRSLALSAFSVPCIYSATPLGAQQKEEEEKRRPLPAAGHWHFSLRLCIVLILSKENTVDRKK